MASSKKLSDQDRTLELNIPEQLTRSKITRPNLEAVPTDLSGGPASNATKNDLNLESLGLNADDDMTIVKPLKIEIPTAAPTPRPQVAIAPAPIQHQQVPSVKTEELRKIAQVLLQEAKKVPHFSQEMKLELNKLRKEIQALPASFPKLKEEIKHTPQVVQELHPDLKHEIEQIEKLMHELKPNFDHNLKQTQTIIESIKPDFDHSIKKIQNLVESIKPDFEDGIKKTMKLIHEFKQDLDLKKSQDQNLENNILSLNELVKECTLNLKSEYQKVAEDMQDLQHKKSKLNSSLLELQNQHDLKIASIKILEDKKAEMARKADLLKDDVYYKENKVRELEEKHVRLKDALAIFPALQHEITDKKLHKDKLTMEINSLSHTLRHHESKLTMLEEQYHQRKSALENIERSIGETHKQIESLKQNELSLMHTCAEEKAKLHQLRNESMIFETNLLSQQKMREQENHHYNERRDQILRELAQAEKKYKSRLVEFEDELVWKKKESEEQIQKEAEFKQMQLKSSLQIIRQSHMHEWDKKHDALADRLCSAIKKGASEVELKHEIDQILHDFFSSHQRSWKL